MLSPRTPAGRWAISPARFTCCRSPARRPRVGIACGSSAVGAWRIRGSRLPGRLPLPRRESKKKKASRLHLPGPHLRGLARAPSLVPPHLSSSGLMSCDPAEGPITWARTVPPSWAIFMQPAPFVGMASVVTGYSWHHPAGGPVGVSWGFGCFCPSLTDVEGELPRPCMHDK